LNTPLGVSAVEKSKPDEKSFGKSASRASLEAERKEFVELQPAVKTRSTGGVREALRSSEICGGVEGLEKDRNLKEVGGSRNAYIDGSGFAPALPVAPSVSIR
jgi:hypothetical protein